jgi:hypothetical protein
MNWISTSERLPEGVTRNDSVPCLVVYHGEVQILTWNCHYQVWDDASGDDFEAEAQDVDFWTPLPEAPTKETK